MIKLETKNASPSAVAVISIQSAGDSSSVVLTSQEARENVNGEWIASRLKRKQILTFIGADGAPCTLEGLVFENQAIEIAAAHKVVVAVELSNELKAAFSAGRVSKAYTALELVRVVEVWDSPKSCLWREKNTESSAKAATFDSASGKIERPAAV